MSVRVIDGGDWTITITDTPNGRTEQFAWKAGAAGAITAANQDSLQQKAVTALATNDTFLAIASPTNAQVAAQVKALTRENSAVIRMLLGLFDTTAGT